MSYQVYYVDGPCHGKTHTEPGSFNPTDRLACGGAVYVYAAAFAPGTGSPAPGIPLEAVGLHPFVVYGGKYDQKVPGIEGETDVFKAWGRLHYALNRGVGKQSERISTAGRRIRRAVR